MVDFVIGQYIKKDSFVHRLDPRTKIIALFFFCISIFVVNSFYGYIFLFALMLLWILLSKVNPIILLRGTKPVFILILITVVFNLFMTQGKLVIKILGLVITDRGIVLSIFLVIRLLLLIFATSLLTLTTSPIEITDALEVLLKPLKKVKFPVHEISMMMSIALRFIPTIYEEADKIMKAQMSRGADFETGGLIKKAKSLLPLLIPLFISAFKRADELAIAMEARCYRGSEGRTKLKKLEFGIPDYISIVVCGILIILAIVVR
ncbi:energy-coupling factor transporter transmembrane component T family protein [Anaerocellum diazotrophicum]|uniref:Energy-coupling factor transporter transmembrane protein EcfT n=1 Tax=Caldicellulosiruptor diazotrophicus TaxID=2806205 RepID=A0ABM7NLB8_9FIRM|nr:energy-coupling factor transporter transmembrane component T [Caldicellulosiruptor diazotrophicus]BCS80892.1 energy-coupling factor transporter transmembrane protein EcfT [Caldicellulosiruptor diazotrophicus]